MNIPDLQTDLAQHVEQTPLCDTHEHLLSEETYVQDGPDLLQNLFGFYLTADLVVAGVSQTDLDRLYDAANPDIRERFLPIRNAWDAVKHTGFGEAVRILAKEVYGMEHITPEALEAAQQTHAVFRAPGQRLKLLQERANLDHVQIDNTLWTCRPDSTEPGFFFSDISWWTLCSGTVDIGDLQDETGIEVLDLKTFSQALGQLFEENAEVAIAVKSQHAYDRPLRWHERTDKEAAAVLDRYLSQKGDVDEAERHCLGDWCLAKGIEYAIEYDLPFKLHTGYAAHHSHMRVDYVKPGQLDALLRRFPDVRLVLMHAAYPYGNELIALAKHYPNVYVDLCWAWSIDPYATSDFVRRCIHAVPSNKLFVFGGDTLWPTSAVAYASQARKWLTRTLQAEIDEGLLSEREAVDLASRYMRENQYACFNIDSKRKTIRYIAESGLP